MITTLEGWLLIYFSGNKERDLVQITWYCRTGIRWLILLRISNKALTEISKRLPFDHVLALFYASSPCHTPSILQRVVLMLPRDTPWLQQIKGSSGYISGGSIRGRNRNEIETIPKYSKREKKEVRPFYYIEASLDFQSWLNLRKADLIATGSTSNSVPETA